MHACVVCVVCVYRNGIFASNGKEWSRQRKAASLIFTVRLLRDVMTDIFVEHSRIFVDRLQQSYDERHKTGGGGGVVDIHDMYFRFTMDSFCDVAFGEKLHCQTTAEPHPFS